MNRQIFFRLFSRNRLAALSMILLCSAHAFAQNDKPKPRDIMPIFETARPPATASGSAQGALPASTADAGKKPKRPPYNRISQKINSGKVSATDRPGKRPPRPAQANIAEARARQIGVTLWQLSEVRPSATIETLLEMLGGKRRYLMPERVSIDTVFEPYDLVRLAFESSRRGYLYVIDQEMYADGTLGDAYMVFPSRRIRSGANLIAPGKPVELPDINGNPFYFELRPADRGGKTPTAEILTVIITDRPITGLQIGERPLLIPENTLNNWRTKWSGRVEIFESSEKIAYSKRERAAGGGTATLTGDDPLPQTIFLVEGNRSAGSLITVPLWYGRN